MAPAAEMIQWQNALATHLARFKRYPNAARSRGEQGTATVAFTIDRDGRLLSSRIVQSSGSSLLDEETLAMLSRAQPMPKPPITAPDSALSLVSVLKLLESLESFVIERRQSDSRGAADVDAGKPTEIQS